MLLPAILIAGTGADRGFTMHRGYIPQGADVLNGTMTVSKAQEVCTGITECTGITFAGDVNAVQRDGVLNYRTQVWLKGTNEWVDAPGHVSFVKKLPECENVRYMRFKRAGHGPYCCEGTGCPASQSYAGFESMCQLPAAAVFGLPRCANLRGEPLLNVAPLGKASASSEYPHAENSGPGAANDGVINASLFHSAVAMEHHTWTLRWAQPVAIAQVVVHNRKEFRARMFGASISIYAADNSVVAAGTLRAARGMYIWTVRPVVRHAVRLEIRTAKDAGCLHFKELEAFGLSEAEMPASGIAFEELPDTLEQVQQNQLNQQQQQLMQQQQALMQQVQQQQAALQQTAAQAQAAAAQAAAAASQAAAHQALEQAKQAISRLAAPSATAPQPQVPPAQPRHAGAPTPRPGTSDGAPASAAAEDGRTMRRERIDEDEIGWMATTGSLTTMVLLLVQFLWVKTRWLDMWN